MKRVFVQLSNDKSCLLVADRIEYSDDSNYVMVYNGSDLVGIIDLLHIVALYMTEPTEKAG